MPKKPKRVSCGEASGFDIDEKLKAGEYSVGYIMSRVEMAGINNKYLDVPINLSIPCTQGSRQIGCPIRESGKAYSHAASTKNALLERGIVLIPIPKLGYKFATPEETMEFARMKLDRETMPIEKIKKYMKTIKKTTLSKESRILYNRIMNCIAEHDNWRKKWIDEGLLGGRYKN